MINPGRGRRLLYVIYAFDGAEELPAWLDKTEELLVKFAEARDVEKQIIKC